MASIVRHRSVKIAGEEEDQTIRLKKWSAAKLFFLVRDFWSLIEEGLEGLGDLNKINEIDLIRLVIEKLLSAEDKAASLVEASVVEPKGLTSKEILEWDACDFILVLTEVIEMNVTEELVKNFRRLLGQFGKKKLEAKKTRRT